MWAWFKKVVFPEDDNQQRGLYFVGNPDPSNSSMYLPAGRRQMVFSHGIVLVNRLIVITQVNK